MNTERPAITDTSIQPGLMVVHGNRLEDLRDLMLAWLAHTPLPPLEDECILVQSNGIGQWLKLALARPRKAGGMGISLAVNMQLPGRFLWQAYRSVLGHESVPDDSPFDKSRLLWRLLRLLPAQLMDPDFSPLQRILGQNSSYPLTLFQLARQVAELFDQYQVYRADWLEDWEQGHDLLRDVPRTRKSELPGDQRWQPKLWRALLKDVAKNQCHSHRGAVHHAFMAHARQLTIRPNTLPQRIIVFGISSLPQQTLEALATLGRISQVLLMVANPCRHYWADIIEDVELLRSAPRRHASKTGPSSTPEIEDLHLRTNPLLAAWGKQGRDYMRLLDHFDTPHAYREHFTSLGHNIDLFSDFGKDNLLHQVQQAVLDLEPLPLDPSQRKVLIPGDDSLRFHIAHNRQREVEILHDNLLALFEQAQSKGQALTPRDVMVMVPDISSYAPHIQAVFGRLQPDDPRYLPYSIVDRPVRGTTPLLVALEHLLHLPESRHGVTDTLGLLDTPALRQRFGFSEHDIPLLRRWVAKAGIRWGLDSAQKKALGLPPVEQNSWRFGLHRMLLGYAVGDGPSLHDIAPCDEISGLDASLLGPLAELLERLQQASHQLAIPAPPTVWHLRLRALLANFFDDERDEDINPLQQLYQALDNWKRYCDEAGLGENVPLAVVREHWLGAIEEHRLSQRFLNGAVNFGTLIPMRAIPFPVVCLLGMDDDAYPRKNNVTDIDLMTAPGQQRPGDRSRREDDRYLFLEALLAARHSLYISWVGRSARDHSKLPPSVLVNQFRDYLATGWTHKVRTPDSTSESKRTVPDGPDPDLLAALTTTYPLHAFSPRYFNARSDPRLFTYAAEWQRAQCARPVAEEETHSLTNLLLMPWPHDLPLDLGILQRFLKSPSRCFYKERLGISFHREDRLSEHEPFTLNALHRYQLSDDLLQAALHAGPSALEIAAQRVSQQGDLPPGQIGTLVLEPIKASIQTIMPRWRTENDRYPPGDSHHVFHYCAHELLVKDTLTDLRQRDQNAYLRLLAWPGTLMLTDKNQLCYDKLLAHWVSHLLVNACELSTLTHIVASDASVQWQPLDVATAKAHLDALLAAMATGLRTPLPIGRKTAFAWLQTETAAGNKKKPDSKRIATAIKAAANCYDGNTYGEHKRGEVEYEPSLKRHWSHFSALYEAGFTNWLHLYRPLLDLTRVANTTP